MVPNMVCFWSFLRLHSNSIPIMVWPLQLRNISNIAYVEEEAILYMRIYFCANSSNLTDIKRCLNSRKWSTFCKKFTIKY